MTLYTQVVGKRIPDPKDPLNGKSIRRFWLLLRDIADGLKITKDHYDAQLYFDDIDQAKSWATAHNLTVVDSWAEACIKEEVYRDDNRKLYRTLPGSTRHTLKVKYNLEAETIISQAAILGAQYTDEELKIYHETGQSAIQQRLNKLKEQYERDQAGVAVPD